MDNSMKMRLFLAFVIVIGHVCAYNNDDVQYVKSVKGGHGGGFQYNAGSNLDRFYQNGTYGQTSRYNVSGSSQVQLDKEIGVCYIEVPTADLVHDRTHIPAGNGSRPDLSRIRTCCKGYIRNIHNFRICDPVCTNGCINGLCTAPETCNCYFDHVRNAAGFCVATCPIGCQNGHCDGGECICKDGYRLDLESKYCVPICKDNCGGHGNCTAPNTCVCKSGYQPSSDGSCGYACGTCEHGTCITPTECRCLPGYSKDINGRCTPQCTQDCGRAGRCISPNVCDYGTGGIPTNVITNPIPSPNPNQYPSYPSHQGSQTQQNPNYYVSNHSSPYYPPHQPLYPYSQTSNGVPQYPNTNQLQNQYPSNYSQSTYNQTANGGIQQNPYQPTLYPSLPPFNNPSNPNQYSPSHTSGIGGYNENKPSDYLPNQPSSYPSHSPYDTNYPGHSNQPSQYPSNYPPYQQPQSNQSTSNNFPNQPSNYPLNYPSNYNSQHPSNSPSGYPANYPYQSNIQDQWPNSGPQCSCVNGQCLEGNRCVCHTGYIFDKNDSTNTRCVPYCPGCTNGSCTSPYHCVCDDGFVMDFSVKGRQTCVKRVRRSVDYHRSARPIPAGVEKLIVFDIPEY